MRIKRVKIEAFRKSYLFRRRRHRHRHHHHHHHHHHHLPFKGQASGLFRLHNAHIILVRSTSLTEIIKDLQSFLCSHLSELRKTLPSGVAVGGGC